MAAGLSVLILLGITPFAVKWLIYRSCLARVQSLRLGLGKLEAVPDTLEPARQNLEAFTRYAETMLPQYYLSWRAWLFRRVRSLLRAAEKDLKRLRNGEDPFQNKRGTFLQTYISDIDGGGESYFIDVPEGYDSKRTWPLVVQLHGLVGLGVPFQQAIPEHREDCITLAPHGKGSIDFKWVAEEEVLRSIREVQQKYSVDAQRICLQGHSMGATGVWSLASHYPQLFWALAASAGNTDHTVWEQLWEAPELPEGSKLGPLRKFLEDADSAITYAPNFLNVHVFCTHGALDDIVPVQHSRNMMEQLRKHGCPFAYREVSLASHASELLTPTSDQIDWLLAGPQPEAHRKVRLKAASLRYGRSYWLEIRRFERGLQFAEVEAEVTETGRITVSAQNVAELAIFREPGLIPRGNLSVRMDSDREILVSPEAWNEQELVLAKRDGRWTPVAPSEGLSKRRGLEGPIEDAMMSRFIVVCGAGGSDTIENTVLRQEAEAFREQWTLRFGYPCRFKVDSEVTEADIKESNLICFGRPDQNLVVRRAASNLPCQFERGKITWNGQDHTRPEEGVKFCYPNPLHPDRYLVVFAANSWRGMFQMNNRFGNWFDWSAFENRNFFDYALFDERSDLPETFLTFGYFDPDWQVSPHYRFDGDAVLRAQAPVWKTPELLEAPAGSSTLSMSDLLPVRVCQLLGAARLDRSFEGHDLHIGPQSFQRGFGVKAPSSIEFDLAAQFREFSAQVGIDPDGQAVTDHHRKHNKLVFEVFGDGKLVVSSNTLDCDSQPFALRCSVSGIRRLRLSVRQESGYRWFLLSAAWAEPRVAR